MSRTSVFSKKEKKAKEDFYHYHDSGGGSPAVSPLLDRDQFPEGGRGDFSADSQLFPPEACGGNLRQPAAGSGHFDCPAEQLHHRGGLHGSLYDPGGSLRLRPEPFPL